MERAGLGCIKIFQPMSTPAYLLPLTHHRQQGGDTRLVQLYSTPLSGFVESLACLPYRYRGQGRDALVLTFRDAKAVVLTWDAASCSLVTSSLHYLEGDSQLRRGRSIFEREPLGLADPEVGQ